jgi:hypothetical protein
MFFMNISTTLGMNLGRWQVMKMPTITMAMRVSLKSRSNFNAF